MMMMMMARQGPLFSPAHSERIAAPGATLRLFEQVFSEAHCDRLFAELRHGIHWRQDSLRIRGRRIPMPRLTAWYGDSQATYSYSGITLFPQPWIPVLCEIKARVEAVAATSFNSVLANLYRDGRDSVAWHSDDEPELGERPIIASVSFGAVRRFVLRHKQRKEIARVNVLLPNGSVLLMEGDTQRFWEHQVPKTAKKIGTRINLTFRTIG